jgi:lysophospholipase L1-like esterase
MEESRRIKSLVFSLVAVVGAFTLSVVAGELVFRALPRFDAPVYRNFSPYLASSSDYLPITLSPNVKFRHESSEFSVVYNINQLGFRGDYPITVDKRNGVRRLLFLGDSFTLGWGVKKNEAFAARVQKLLSNPSVATRYESINAAYHAGYSPDAYYAFMKREGLNFKPDIVVIAYYANDIDDMNSNVWLKTDELGGPIRIRTLRRYASWDGNIASGFQWNERVPLLRESRMFTALAQVLNRYASLDTKLNALNGITPERAMKNSEQLSRIVRAFDVLAEKHNFDITHVLIPPKKQIAGNREISIMRNAIQRGSVFPVIDLSKFLRPCHYFNKDGHFNRIGHALAGDIIAASVASSMGLRHGSSSVPGSIIKDPKRC